MHPNEDVLNDYAEGALDETARQEVERHLEACETCRELVADLREIREAAASLDDRDPPVRAWSRIERAIQLDAELARGDAAGSAATRADGARAVRASVPTGLAALRASRSNLGWLAAAAALVIATVVGVRYAPGRHTPDSAADTAAHNAPLPSDVSAETVEAELRAAESHYDRAIQGLEQITKSEQGALDPNTAATLQKNLQVIDQAISESRAAIRAQPTSEPARASLMENFKTKLALLQDTVALINEMRKGNDAGAARAASGLRNKGN